MLKQFLSISFFITLVACTSDNPLDDYDVVTPTTMHNTTPLANDYPEEDVNRGKYLAELLACATCHTDGALVGEPNSARVYGGSNVGIAYSNPMIEKRPGIVYPANLTPDVKTGLGSWLDKDIKRLIKTGIGKDGRRHMSIMPWPAYAKLTEEDTRSIVAFLRSLPAVEHQVPANVMPGERAIAPFVHFGVYRSKRFK